jgi:hypothetical protein
VHDGDVVWGAAAAEPRGASHDAAGWVLPHYSAGTAFLSPAGRPQPRAERRSPVEVISVRVGPHQAPVSAIGVQRP